jgi:hypothetical protein
MRDKAAATSEPDAAQRGLRAPAGANAIAFGVLFVVSCAFLFVSYCMARALIGGFGAGMGTVALAVSSSALASIFLWWLVPLADSGEIIGLHLPADGRARRNQCPHCGYPHEGRATCTECGASTAPLPAWTLSARPVRRMGVIVFLALVVGSAAGEWWCRLDEARFGDECAKVSDRPYSRTRTFPTAFARMRVDESGQFTSEAWPEDRKERSWQPSDPASRERGLGWRSRGANGATEEGANGTPDRGAR